MKRIMIAFLVLVMAFSCFAAGAEENKNEETAVQAAMKVAASMSWDELLAKAKEEIGDNELIVLAATSRFDESYFTELTGIKMKALNIGSTEIYEKVSNEVENGLYLADIIGSPDTKSVGDMVANGWFENFVPDAFKSLIKEDEQNPLIVNYYNRVFMYNNDNGKLTNRITNVWQLTEPEMKGFEMKNPILETVTMNFFITLTKPENQKILADAYKSYYGKDWVSDGTYKNIAYEWVHKFIQNATFNTSDGPVVTNLSKSRPGSVAMAVFSKFRSVDTANLGLAAFDGVEGFSGFLYPFCLGISATAKYPYTACLYVNYILRAEGYSHVFGKDMGGYSANPEIALSEKSLAAGDRPLDFWRTCLIAEDMDYIQSVYAETFTRFSQWCADK